ncbi:DUF938 domain-containing protein [Alteromonas gilva]|uniref:DUF938 domain-containing protein n=1 Tax=Alteromonas gilva TaxID=2987522 RepID=A0ABT5L0G8_9ALTE|nr:DUF938 domain-containing protein [Alteromonas gilva]MDC8830525.1 DUF938 domain-containing protein [Alteromonas gilva]
MDKPFSQACENNKGPILAVLKDYFAEASSVLEIGSGTGQHAVYFAQALPHLSWQTSDVPAHHGGIRQWLADAALANLKAPITLKIGEQAIPQTGFDAIYSANTAHIMFADEVALMMRQIAQTLPPGGVFCQYGPFIHNGQFSSASNEAFHHSLLIRGLDGYKHIEQLVEWAGAQLQLTEIRDMPANNLCLVWRKSSPC